LYNVSAYFVAQSQSVLQLQKFRFNNWKKIKMQFYSFANFSGRFGKMGKLVDLSDDSGPPAAYTSFKYRKVSS